MTQSNCVTWSCMVPAELCLAYLVAFVSRLWLVVLCILSCEEHRPVVFCQHQAGLAWTFWNTICFHGVVLLLSRVQQYIYQVNLLNVPISSFLYIINIQHSHCQRKMTNCGTQICILPLAGRLHDCNSQQVRDLDKQSGEQNHPLSAMLLLSGVPYRTFHI